MPWNSRAPTEPQLVACWAQLTPVEDVWLRAFSAGIGHLREMGHRVLAPDEVVEAPDLLVVGFMPGWEGGTVGLLEILLHRDGLRESRARHAVVVPCGRSDPPIDTHDIARLSGALRLVGRAQFALPHSPDELADAVVEWMPRPSQRPHLPIEYLDGPGYYLD